MTSLTEFENMGLKDKLKALAPYALQKLAAFEDADLRVALRNAIKEEFNAIRDEVADPKTGVILANFGARLRGLTVDDLDKEMQQRVTQALADTPRMSARARRTMDDVGTDGYAAMVAASVSMMPAAVREVYASVYLKGRTPVQLAQDYYKLDAAQLTAVNSEIFSRLPARAIAQSLHELAQKFTPEAAADALKALSGRMSPDAVADILLESADVAKDLLTTAVEQDRIGFANPAAAQMLCGKLALLFDAACAGMAQAGLTPDTDLGAAFDSAYKGFTPGAPAAAPSRARKPKITPKTP